MAKNAAKRKRIFDKYAENWVLYSKYLNLPKEWDGMKFYACPMCLTLYDDSGLDQSGSKRLTLEDVPPAKLGGKAIILTCNDCNNRSGHDLDAHLLNQTKALNVIAGKEGASKNVTFRINDGRTFRGEVYTPQNETFGFRFKTENNPIAKKGVASLIRNWKGSKVQFNIQGGNPARIEVAKLRIAYLLAFAKFGFGYVVNNTQ